MNIDELEEALSEVLPVGFQIETNSRGQVVVYTGLRQDDDGELLEIDSDDDEEDLDLDTSDDDFESLDEEFEGED